MKELFPAKQVMGFAASLILTAIALLVVNDSISFKMGMVILLVTAFIQAFLQLVVFMHAGESEDGKSIYVNIIYAVFLALATIFGSILIFTWDMM